MIKYYQMVIANGPRWILEVDGETAPLDIWACNNVISPGAMRFLVSQEGKRVDFGHTGWASIPVVSRRMADCLNSIAPNDIQRIPATVGEEPNNNWEVLNVLAHPDCIDHDQSRITYYPTNHLTKPGKPRGVLKLVIDPKRVEGHDIFRPFDWEIALIVSESVKGRLESLETTGVEYWPVTE